MFGSFSDGEVVHVTQLRAGRAIWTGEVDLHPHNYAGAIGDGYGQRHQDPEFATLPGFAAEFACDSAELKQKLQAMPVEALRRIALELDPISAPTIGLAEHHVKHGTQAERHAALRPGMILTSVQDTVVDGKSYNAVMELIATRHKAGRTLELTFKPRPSDFHAEAEEE